jgi:surface antigen
MKNRIIIALAAIALSGCGVETMGTAATGAVLKKQELEQGRKNLQNAQQRIDQAVQQMNQSAQRSADDGIK